MRGHLLFLGTGGSMGIPILGCTCEVCQSDSPFNKRLRPSVLVKVQDKQFLIDAGPDFRFQALQHHIVSLDGVLFTHGHHDHIAGIDDLRPLGYNRENPLPAFASVATCEDIKGRFPYIFEPNHFYEKFAARIKLFPFSLLEGTLKLERIPVSYVTYEQGITQVNGYRFGSLAYISDIKRFSSSIFDHLKGVKTLVISALKYTSSPMHLTVDEAIDFAQQLKAETVWLTHISHELEHEKTNAYLPNFVKLAYDGLEIEFG